MNSEFKISQGLFHLLFILPLKKHIVISYYNNFDKFKHIIYSTLLNIPDSNDKATVFPLFIEQYVRTLFRINPILGSERTESDNSLQQVGVANGATN